MIMVMELCLTVSDETAGIYVLELEKENEVAIKSCTEKFEETKVNYIWCILIIIN